MTETSKNYSPSVSVIMSVYAERHEWIKASIDSVLTQTYGNLELIIIYDNPENAATWKLLQAIANTDKRILLIRNNENYGLTKSLNIGIRHIRGRFIARIDADDIWKKEKLQKQIVYLDKYSNIDGVGTCIEFIDEDGDFVNIMDFPLTPLQVACKMVHSNPIIHSSIVIRVSSVWEMLPNLYDEQFISAQDYALWTLLVQKGKSLANLSARLVKYRRSSQQITQFRHSEQQSNAQIIKEQYITHIAEQCGIPNITNLDIKALAEIIKNQKSSMQQRILYSYLYYKLLASTLTKTQVFIICVYSRLMFRYAFKPLLKLLLK